MRRVSFLGLVLVGLGALVGVPRGVEGQSQVAAISADQMEAFARAHVAISLLRDRAQAEFADPRNKKDEVQVQLREKLRGQIAQVLKEHKLTEAEFDRFTWLVSADTAQRRAFDARVAQLAVRKEGR